MVSELLTLTLQGQCTVIGQKSNNSVIRIVDVHSCSSGKVMANLKVLLTHTHTHTHTHSESFTQRERERERESDWLID